MHTSIHTYHSFVTDCFLVKINRLCFHTYTRMYIHIYRHTYSSYDLSHSIYFGMLHGDVSNELLHDYKQVLLIDCNAESV